MTVTPIAELEQRSPRRRRSTCGALPEYWGLRWRRVVGPRIAPYLQPLILSAVHRKVRNRMWWRRWAREGY